MTHVVTVELAKRGDWFLATSKELPGFFVTHLGITEFYDEIPAAIKLFFKAIRNQDVTVKQDSPIVRHSLNELHYVAEAA